MNVGFVYDKIGVMVHATVGGSRDLRTDPKSRRDQNVCPTSSS